jgi:hypothetical protein
MIGCVVRGVCGAAAVSGIVFLSWAGTAAGAPAERPAYFQVVNPADKQREMQESSESATQMREVTAPQERTTGTGTETRIETQVRTETAPGEPARVQLVEPPAPRRSYELPPVDVVGEVMPAMREEQRVGPYAQPRWTARRRFPSTRVYVRPPGTAEFEYWLRPTVTKDGDTEIRTLYELSVGFEPRLQLDLYLRTDQEGDDSEMLLGQQVEIRYALADWGKIWGNPTLYLEWVGLEQRPDAVEAKLLLGGELAERWHWGSNLVGEFQTGGEREYEYQLTGGVSYTVVDSRLSLGGEAQFIVADVKDDRGDFGTPTILLGPSVQWKPTERINVTFAPLVGLTDESPDFRAFFVFGYEF